MRLCNQNDPIWSGLQVETMTWLLHYMGLEEYNLLCYKQEFREVVGSGSEAVGSEAVGSEAAGSEAAAGWG